MGALSSGLEEVSRPFVPPSQRAELISDTFGLEKQDFYRYLQVRDYYNKKLQTKKKGMQFDFYISWLLPKTFWKFLEFCNPSQRNSVSWCVSLLCISPCSPDSKYEAMTSKWPSVWVKISSSWICIALYVWTLVAPLVLVNRDFDWNAATQSSMLIHSFILCFTCVLFQQSQFNSR